VKTCPSCQGKRLQSIERDETATVSFTYRGASRMLAYVAKLPAIRCAACGAVFDEGWALERFELHVAQAAMALGVTAGGILRYARKALGRKATELADILDVTAETISHWENDRTEISRFAWVAIGDLVSDRISGVDFTRARLAAFRSPRLPTRRVKLSVGRDSSTRPTPAR